jgi:hypothetical protein
MVSACPNRCSRWPGWLPGAWCFLGWASDCSWTKYVPVRTVDGVEPADVIDAVVSAFPGLAPKRSWGETSLFYNPDGSLPHGVYFSTVKQQDGVNDKASSLDRPGVFRLSFGLPAGDYEALFGPRPARPAKGGCVATGHDFTAVDELMPHPVYGWMGWVQILSPSRRSFAEIQPLLSAGYESVVQKYTRQVARLKA